MIPSLQEINTQDSDERAEKHKTYKTYRKQAMAEVSLLSAIL